MESPELYGLLGHNISYSVSPTIFNNVFRTRQINSLYASFDIKPGDHKRFIDSARLLDIRGFNVTTPHKVNIIRYLDSLDDSAESVAAVNIVVNKNGKLIGYNADILGVKSTIEDHLKFSLRGRHVILIGAGGAARAAINYINGSRPAKIVIANRTAKHAKMLAEINSESKADLIAVSKIEVYLRDHQVDIIINATPVPTVRILKEIPRRIRIFDMSYRPGVFPYIKSRLRCDGRYMLAAQASRSLRIMCGINEKTAKIYKMIKGI